MKKLFISQPMRGKSEETILVEREKALQEVRDCFAIEAEVLDTFFNDVDGKSLEFLCKSIMMLAQADIAYFAPGWENACGCRIQNICAKEYKLTVIEA